MPVPARRDRWRLWNWRVRTKLLAVLLVPAVAAGVLGGLQISNELQGVQALGVTSRQVDLGIRTAKLIHELQAERVQMAGFVVKERDEAGEANIADDGPLALQKRRVDGMVSSVLGEQIDGLDGVVRERYQHAENALDGLGALRWAAEQTKYSEDAVITAYTSMVGTLLELNREIARATGAREVSDIASAADALGRAKEQVAQQHAVVLVSMLRNQMQPSQLQQVQVADARYGAALAEFLSVARTAERQRFQDVVTGAEVDDRERMKQTQVLGVLAGDAVNADRADLVRWDEASGATTDKIREVENLLFGQLQGGAVALGNKAGADAVRDATILLGSLLLTLLLVVVVARSMLVPLRVLRNTAFDVADRRLPQAIQRMRDLDGDIPDVTVAPVAVHTREEIGQVARAFDAVHAEAVRLAGEQALLRANVNDMFVNLSRRSQGLVERQLRLIDQLENSEQDPEQLANLFQLDHLATRMRRNSENLLVLAGAELGRRSARPVPAVDVLRAAVSEVEQYQRVVVQPPPPVSVLGMAVNDIVHLTAELLDNATSFSCPSTRVTVNSRLSEDGELIVEITDQGVGIEDAELVEINQRLAEPPVVDVSVSRRMGLFVVGRLAIRHGIAVRLAASGEEHGLTATVVVPVDLIQTGELETMALPTGTGRPVVDDDYVDEQLSNMATQMFGEGLLTSTADDFGPADWPNGDNDGRATEQPDEAEPVPYEIGVTAPMQVRMVDSISGSDLFTPASMPTLNEQPDPAEHAEPVEPARQPAMYDAERFAELASTGQQPVVAADDYYEAWPDTDQDMELGRLTPVASEDYLGVGQVAGATAGGPVETTPIYEEMVSAWFRETAPATVDAPEPAVSVVSSNAGGGHQEYPVYQADREYLDHLTRLDHHPPGTNGAADSRPARPAQPQRPAPPPVTRPEPPRRLAMSGESTGIIPAATPPPAQPPTPPVRRAEPATPPRPMPAQRPERGAELPRRSARPVEPVEPPRAEPPARPTRLKREERPTSVPPRLEPAPVGAAPSGPDVDFSSPADEGWVAAGALLAPTSNGFTAAGLPKRRRGEHLVPGGGMAGEPANPAPARSPDSIRGRLASYQRGLRQGRDARTDLAHASLERRSERGDQHSQQSTSEERQ